MSPRQARTRITPTGVTGRDGQFEDASDEAIAMEATGVEAAAKGMTVAESTAKMLGVLGAKKGGVMKKPAAVGKAASGGTAKLPDGVVARFKEADEVRVH